MKGYDYHDQYEQHPLAEMFPLLKDAEFDDLVEDIRKHGLREPIILFEQKIIDGRNRERACIKAGVEPRYRSMEFDNHDAATAYVISKNIRRRHLTPEQKRELIEKLLRADPTKSDRQIARTVKADNKTVGAVRKRAEAREDIPHVSKRTDSKGRSQLAHKRNTAKHPPKRTKSTVDLSDQCIEAVRKTIERTIKDLRRTGATTFEELFAAVVKGWTLRSCCAERGIEIELGFESRQLSKECPSMTSVRKKTSSEIFRTPRWLRGPPRSLRSIINPEEVSIYRRMRKAIIQELRPKTPIEWILVNEFVNAQFSAMRYGTWQAAVMQFSVGEGLRRAVKNRLRSGNKGSEADLDWRAQELAGSMRPYVNDHAIEAEMYLSRRSEMDSIHKRQLSAQRRRDSSLRQLEQRRSRQQKEAAQIARALIDERNREEFAAPEMATVARKNGAGDAPELKTAGSEPLRKSQNGHG